MPRRSAAKLVLLTSSFGPVFRGKFATVEIQCAYLQEKVRDPERARVLTPDLIRRWRREGVSRVRSRDNLHVFCEVVRDILGMRETPETIAKWIADDDVEEYEFAARFKIDRHEVDYIAAQFDASRGSFFPDPSKLYVVHGRDKRPDAYGLYVMERRARGSRQHRTTKCVLIIDRYIQGERDRAFIFVKMLVPQLAKPRRVFTYDGMLLQPVNHKYFLLQSRDSDIGDFVTIITDVGSTPVDVLHGIYVSVNIQGKPEPETRDVTIRKVSSEISDKLIAEHAASILK